jgi:multidrug efflux pump subunit AcrB
MPSRRPAVESVGAAVGAGGGLYTLNDGRLFIQLKPHGQRPPIWQVIDRLRTNLARMITLYMQAARDITIGARLKMGRRRSAASTSNRRAGSRCQYRRWSTP